MPWQCPKVTIGGLPIPEQEFSWALTAGPSPYITDFWIPQHQYQQFLALKNPVTIQLEVTGGVRGQPDLQIIMFQNTWLLTPARVDEVQCIWRIADARYSWQGKKMSFCYNKTRIKNELGMVVASNEISPAKLREPYDTYSQGRYIPWTVQPNGKPWTVAQIIEREFAKLNIPFVNTNSQDLSFILENIEMEGEDIFRGIAYLLQLGRLNMSINPAGEAYIYSIFSYEYNNENVFSTYIETLFKTHPGTIYKQDKRKIRPFAVDVHFKKEIETWFTVGEVATTYTADQYKTQKVVGISPLTNVWTYEDIADRRVVGLINVIQAPLQVTIDGKVIQIGEWVPMHKFLAAYGLTETQIRQGMFGGVLETTLAMSLYNPPAVPYDQAERIALHVCSAIKDSYRQTFMIEPYYMDRIDSWRPRRVSVINTFDRYSQVSPLFADYCVIPFLRNPAQAKGLATWNYEVYNWLVDTEDPKREKPTPGTVHVINQPLGIFRIGYPTPKNQTTNTIIPFGIEDSKLPLPAVGSTAPYLAASHIKQTYSLATIMSVIWSVDKNDSYVPNGANYSKESKYWSVPIGFGAEGEREFHPIEYYSNAENARFGINDPTFPVNYTFLQTLSYSEAARIMIGFKDFYAGVITGAGFVAAKPVANIKSVMYCFSPANGLETIIDMRDSLPVPMLEHNLKQEHIDFLRKHISRVDNANEARGGA